MEPRITISKFANYQPKVIRTQIKRFKSLQRKFIQGTIIDKEFVKNIISECFNRPTKEISEVNSDIFVYYSDFAKNWLDKKADQWKISAKQTMPKYLKKQYEDFFELYLDFEKTIDSKLILKDMCIDDFYEFSNYCENEGYNPSTIKRMLSRMKFFCSSHIDKAKQGQRK